MKIEHFGSAFFVENKENVRSDYGDIEALAESILTIGLVIPVIGYMDKENVCLIAGHRRLAAINLLISSKKVDSFEVPTVVIPKKDVGKKHIIAAVENITRQNLTPIELLKQVKFLTDKKIDVKKQAILLGFSETTANQLNALAKHGTKNMLAAIEGGKISIHGAIELIRIGDKKTIDDVLERSLVRYDSILTPSLVQKCIAQFGRKIKLAPFDISSCKRCNKRTSNQTAMFNEQIDDFCLDSKCWQEKCLGVKQELELVYRECGIKLTEKRPDMYNEKTIARMVNEITLCKDCAKRTVYVGTDGERIELCNDLNCLFAKTGNKILQETKVVDNSKKNKIRVEKYLKVEMAERLFDKVTFTPTSGYSILELLAFSIGTFRKIDFDVNEMITKVDETIETALKKDFVKLKINECFAIWNNIVKDDFVNEQLLKKEFFAIFDKQSLLDMIFETKLFHGFISVMSGFKVEGDKLFVDGSTHGIIDALLFELDAARGSKKGVNLPAILKEYSNEN